MQQLGNTPQTLENQRFRTAFAWGLAAALLLAGLCLVYPQAASWKGCLLTGDHREQHYPWATFLSSSLSRGELPWWTWKIHCGFPLLAEGQIGAFYPLNLLLHGLLPSDGAYASNFLLHMFLSGFFLILYCRKQAWGWPSAALACMSYLLGNAFGGAFYNMTSLKTLCWFPLGLYAADQWRDSGRWRYAGLLGLVFGLELLAGYLQIAVYAMGMTLVYAALSAFGRRARSGRSDRNVWRGFLGYGAAVLVAACLFLPQFLATYPLSQASGRVGLQESFAYLGSFPPWGLVTVFFPKWEGLLRTLGLYAGIMPLFFALLSLAAWREAAVRRWWLFCAVALLLAMGGYSPLYVGLIKWSHFYGFRVPSKLLFFANTSLAVLAGWGMELWRRGAISPKAWSRTVRIFSLMSLIALASLLLGSWLLDAYKEEIAQAGYAIVQRSVHGKPYHAHSMDHYRASVDALVALAQDLTRWNNPKIAVSIGMLLAAIAGIWLLKHIGKRSLAVSLCLMLTAGDLYAYTFVNKLVGDFSAFEKIKEPPAAALFLKKDTSLYRIFGYRGISQDLSLVPSYNFLFDIEDIGAYSPFVLRRYRDLLEGLGAADDSTGRSVQGPETIVRKLPLLSMLNVKYIVTPKQTILPGMSEVFADGKEHVYANPGALPRFFFAAVVRTEPDAGRMLEAVKSMRPEDRQAVWLEEPVSVDSPGGGTAELLAYGESSLTLRTTNNGEGLLFASLLHYPGMTALVDGKPVRLFRANYCFCAIKVPPGMHEIRFFFDPAKSLRP